MTSNSDSTGTRSGKLPVLEKFSYGLGTVGDQFTTNAVNNTVKPVFNIFLGMNPTLIGLALMIGKLVDAFSDPLMGSISDNTRTRMGRRRPFILFGSLACAFAFPLLWFVPTDWSDQWLFFYLLIATSFVAVLSTIYSVPWTALGFEMTPDYHERTQVMVYRTLLTKGVWFIIPWLWAWSQLSVFSNPLVGMRWIGLGIGVLIIVSGLVCFFGCKERYYKAAEKQVKIKLIPAIKLTFENKPFLIVMAITVIQVLCITTTIGGLGLYVITYWVHGGNTVAGATSQAALGSINAVLGFALIPLISLFAGRYGKRATMTVCLGMAALGCALNWFCYTPDSPMVTLNLGLISIGPLPVLLLIPLLFTAPGFTAFWLINGSMRADVVDHDEIRTGFRREGAYGAIGRWIEKLAFAFGFLISGAILDTVGFDATLGAAQSEASLFNMRLAFSVVPAVCLLAGIVLTFLYPLSEQVMRDYREQLESRRGTIE